MICFLSLMFFVSNSSPSGSPPGGTGGLLSVFAAGMCALLLEQPDLPHQRSRDIGFSSVWPCDLPPGVASSPLGGHDGLRAAVRGAGRRGARLPVHLCQPGSFGEGLYLATIPSRSPGSLRAEGAAAQVLFFSAPPQHAAADVAPLQAHRSRPGLPAHVPQTGTAVQNMQGSAEALHGDGGQYILQWTQPADQP